MVAVSLAVATALAVGDADAWADAPPIGKKLPRTLWQQYPLGKKGQLAPARTDTSGTEPRQVPVVVHPQLRGGDNLTVLWVAGAGVVLLGLLGVKVLFANSSDTRGNGGSQVREFLRPQSRREQEEELRVPEEGTAETAQASPAGSKTENDLAVVGEHITSVLAAAEAAASTLRADAESEATVVREDAEQAATEIRRRARQEAETTRASAQQILEEAEAGGADMRSEADRYSANQRREAEAHATKLILEAERKAAAIADTSQERHHVVLTNIATAEGRLRELATSLRHVASALDTVVGDEQGVATEAVDSLEESLRPRPHSVRGEVTPNP